MNIVLSSSFRQEVPWITCFGLEDLNHLRHGLVEYLIYHDQQVLLGDIINEWRPENKMQNHEYLAERAGDRTATIFIVEHRHHLEAYEVILGIPFIVHQSHEPIHTQVEEENHKNDGKTNFDNDFCTPIFLNLFDGGSNLQKIILKIGVVTYHDNIQVGR